MATNYTPAVVVGSIATLATVPLHRKIVPTSIIIDNQGVVVHTITFRDDFTTDAGVNNVAAAQTIQKCQYSVGAGLTASIKADELNDKEFIGALKCYADSADPLCIITVDYKII